LPVWAIVIGWILACSSILWVPGYIVYKLATGEGTLREVCFKILRLIALVYTIVDSLILFASQRWINLFQPQYSVIQQIVAERAKTVGKSSSNPDLQTIKQ